MRAASHGGDGQVEHTIAERKVLESIDHPFLVRLRYAFQVRTRSCARVCGRARAGLRRACVGRGGWRSRVSVRAHGCAPVRARARARVCAYQRVNFRALPARPQSPSKLYLVLDYLTGGELFFHLKQARRFNEEVCQGR